MNTYDVWSVAGAIIASVGGAGAIICGVAGFVSNRLAKRIDAKYAQRISKELEKYKYNLEERRYVTKTQFDREFEIYHQLSIAFFNMVVKLSSFTKHKFDMGNNETNGKGVSVVDLRGLIDQTSEAQNVLYSNAAFIPKEIYDLYDSVMGKASNLFWRYYEKVLKYKSGQILYSEIVCDEDKLIENVIESEYHNVNSKLRKYLEKLTIIE